jgi:hypothetical protein
MMTSLTIMTLRIITGHIMANSEFVFSIRNGWSAMRFVCYRLNKFRLPIGSLFMYLFTMVWFVDNDNKSLYINDGSMAQLCFNYT